MPMIMHIVRGSRWAVAPEPSQQRSCHGCYSDGCGDRGHRGCLGCCCPCRVGRRRSGSGAPALGDLLRCRSRSTSAAGTAAAETQAPPEGAVFGRLDNVLAYWVFAGRGDRGGGRVLWAPVLRDGQAQVRVEAGPAWVPPERTSSGGRTPGFAVSAENSSCRGCPSLRLWLPCCCQGHPVPSRTAASKPGRLNGPVCWRGRIIGLLSSDPFELGGLCFLGRWEQGNQAAAACGRGRAVWRLEWRRCWPCHIAAAALAAAAAEVTAGWDAHVLTQARINTLKEQVGALNEDITDKYDCFKEASDALIDALQRDFAAERKSAFSPRDAN